MEDRTDFIARVLRHYVGCEVDIAYQQKKHYATLLPVYRSKEKYFVIRTSQSSGAVYRQYLNLGVIKGRLSKCE